MKYKKMGFVFLLIIILFVFGLLYGKLFPLSPYVIGFTKHEFKHSIIYLEQGSSYENYDEIDNYIASVEKFHKLKFFNKPRIYIFSNKDSYLRRNITRARFFAYSNNKLVVSPWAIDESKQGVISLETYIKHELSHIILYQNMGYLSAYYYPQWLMEGIAVYSTNQMGTSCYPSKKKTLDILKKGIYFPPYLWKTNQEDSVELRIKDPTAFKYSEFASIVDFLIEKNRGGRK